MQTHQPLMHRILIKPEIKTETKSGIVIATDDRRAAVDCDKGQVVAIGETAYKAFGYDSPPIAVGDRVIYAKYGARVMKIRGELFIACNDEDVYLKVLSEDDEEVVE